MRPAPILKWAGGKARLIEQYRPHLPRRFSRYFEPFAGGAALFFFLRGELGEFPATLSDANEELINCYRVVRDRPGPLIALLEQYQREHSQEFYYQQRALTPHREVHRAARLIYLNKTCFNGLYRVNSKGQFNVPMGRYKNPAILQQERILAASRALQSVQLRVMPFTGVAGLVDKGDFVYFDPPYQPVSSTSNFTSYTQDPFGAPEQDLLAALFAELADRGAIVLLSNSETVEVRERYSAFAIHSVKAPRFINSKSDQRAAVEEVLVASTPSE